MGGPTMERDGANRAYSENETPASMPDEMVLQPGEIFTLSTFSANWAI